MYLNMNFKSFSLAKYMIYMQSGEDGQLSTYGLTTLGQKTRNSS